MKVSISKSVARAFAVMEQFRELRRPATATEIRRRLNCPHSSAVAVLYNLTELGYLSHDREAGLFFPTGKIWSMADWLRPSLRAPGKLGALVDQVARDTGHTTVIYSRVSLFVNALMIRAGDSQSVAPPPAGVGPALALSTPGLAILAQLDDDSIEAVLRSTGTWLNEAGARIAFDLCRTRATIAAARDRGFVAGRDQPQRNTDIVAYPMTSPFDGGPLALAVRVPLSLSPAQLAEIRGAMEFRLHQRPDNVPPRPAPVHMRAGLPQFRSMAASGG